MPHPDPNARSVPVESRPVIRAEDVAFRVINKFSNFLIFFDSQVKDIPFTLKEEVAKCYIEVFNEAWKESWTLPTALKEINKTFSSDSLRIPKIVLQKSEVDGSIDAFAWGETFHVNMLDLDRDFPANLPRVDLKASLRKIKYFFDKLMLQERILFLREMGAKKKARNLVGPELLLPILESSIKEGCNAILYWTNINSATFRWGIRLGWQPIYVYEKQNLIVLSGSISHALAVAKGFYSGESRDAFGEMKKNKDKFYCTISIWLFTYCWFLILFF